MQKAKIENENKINILWLLLIMLPPESLYLKEKKMTVLTEPDKAFPGILQSGMLHSR